MSTVHCSQLVYMNVSGIVYNGPCLFLSMGVSSEGSGKTVEVYDGLNTSGRQIMRYKLASNVAFERKPRAPIYCETGLYVSFADENILADFEVVPAQKGGLIL